jgi:hypothetical protein
MKATIFVLACLLFLSHSLIAAEPITRRIRSNQPILIEGNWIYPENGWHAVVLTDSNIVVSGHEYIRINKLEQDAIKWKLIEKPQIDEAGYLDWLIITARDSARVLLEEGMSSDEIWDFMNSYFAQHIDNNSIWISGRNKECGIFKLKHSKISMPVGVSVPKKVAKPEYNSYEIMQNYFQDLCSGIEKGMVIKKESGTIIMTYPQSKNETKQPKKE